MIGFQNVSHKIRRTGFEATLLSHVNFVVDDLERVGIYAPASSGKSTLAKIICKIQKPQFGTVRHRGRVSWPVGAAGMIHPELTIHGNIKTVAGLTGIDYLEAEDFCLSFCGLNKQRTQLSKTLSPIQRAIFAFGLAMMVPAQHYVFDDKVAVGDRDFQDRCDGVISTRLKNAGMILISRNKRIIEANCDRFFKLGNGKLRECADLSDSSRNYSHV